MPRERRNSMQYTVRAQISGTSEVQDVQEAMMLLNDRAGVELTHAQFVVALARFYIKARAKAEAANER